MFHIEGWVKKTESLVIIIMMMIIIMIIITIIIISLFILFQELSLSLPDRAVFFFPKFRFFRFFSPDLLKILSYISMVSRKSTEK